MPDKLILAMAGAYGPAARDLFCDPEASPTVKAIAQALLYLDADDQMEILEYLQKRIEKAAPSVTSTERGADQPNG